ncbi:tetratricopeptide repeat-containing sensor histidine kinase [Flavobacterium acetivorans]|uniref:tetratricopeptide repeat-containing sensor histidine kinase n=1 Tax=Flavobacterium acetivorans TaxID=2893883 RepID=UPI001E3ACAA5|nr:tetratricopeptide repeat-containing sensor histidine kinase [Flavobacterium sp. F-29]UFH34246.1 histidine kinase [Flavobacterium sp. F-29]
MFQKKRILCLLLLLGIFSSNAFSQSKTPPKKAIIKLAQDATTLMHKENYEKSLVKSRLALKYAIAIKDNVLIATCYNTIAANFDGISESEKAVFYYKKALLYAQRTNSDNLKNWINNNLGNIYFFDKKEYEKGIYYYKKSLEFSTKTKDSAQIYFTKLNIAWAYFDIGDFDKGLVYLNYINKHHSRSGDASTIVALNMLNGMYYSHSGEAKKATIFFEEAIKQGIMGEEKSDLSFSHEEYAKFLMKKGNYKKAYENLVLFNKITKELNDEEKLKKANVAGINLELDEYKREIDNIETKYKSEQQLLLEKQSKNKQISIIIISILLLIIILFYFFFQNTRLKQKNDLKDVESKIQLKILDASISGQEMERKKIAAFLHDNISALLSSAGLHLSVFCAQNQITDCEEIKKTKTILSDAHDNVRDLSHRLLPSLLVRFGLFYALNDLCEKNSNSNIQFEYSSSIATKIRYREEFELKIYFIVTELFNNIIKHSQATNAKLTIEQENNQLLIEVKDNGKGFDTTESHIIEGFGLNRIRARLNNIEGEITIESVLYQGTNIYIKAPFLQNES